MRGRRGAPADRRPEHSDELTSWWIRDVRVELAGHVVRLADLSANPERHELWFRQARRRPGHARCLCCHDEPRLVIRELGARFHLARWPETAEAHVPDCPFATRFRPARGSSRSAITVTAMGTRIAMSAPVADPTYPRDARDQRDAQHLSVAAESCRSHPLWTGTVSLLGLLHHLWAAAGLNDWHHRSRRRWHDCHASLTHAIADLRLGRVPAPRLLHVVAPYRPTEHDPARDTRLASFLRPLEQPERLRIRGGPRRGRRRHVPRRRLLLSELKNLSPTQHGYKLQLRHFPRPLFLTAGEQDRLIRTYPAAFLESRPPNARRVVLALVEGTPHGYLRLTDVAVQLTSPDYVPAESPAGLATPHRSWPPVTRS